MKTSLLNVWICHNFFIQLTKVKKMSNKDFHQYDDKEWFLQDRPKSNSRSHKLFNWDHVEPVLSVVPAFQNEKCYFSWKLSNLNL